MTNNYVPNSDLAYIIGDGGISRASPAPTRVAGDKVNACLEIQSTTRADIFLKPKTDAQISAIPNPTPGMMAFSSDSEALVVRGSGSWDALVPSTPPSILYSETIVSRAQLTNVFAGIPLNILAAPGAGFYYNIHGFSVLRSNGNSTIIMGSANFILLYNDGSFTCQAAVMDNDVFETSGAVTYIDYAPTEMVNTISGLSLSLNQLNNSPIAVFISGPGASITGGTTYLSVRIWYSILPSTF